MMRTCSLRSNTSFGFRPVRGGGHAVQNIFHFLIGKRRGRFARPDKSGDARRVADDVPGVVVHIHFHQHVAGIQHPRGNHLLAAANFHDVLGRNHHPADLFLQPERGHAAFQAFLHLLLKSRIGVDDVPLLCHVHSLASVPKKFNHALDEPAGGAIHAKEKNSEKRHRHNHHPGGHKYFTPRRPGDLPHLDANFVQKTARTGGDIRQTFRMRT